MNDEKVDNMPIWQDHERRITTLENTFSQYGSKIEGLERQMHNIEGKIDQNGKQQKELLDQLIKHHLDTNRFKMSKRWQLILNIFGAGGLLTVFIYAILQFLGGL